MNKAILIAAGVFTLMNSVVGLVSRHAPEVEVTLTIPYETPADSTLQAMSAGAPSAADAAAVSTTPELGSGPAADTVSVTVSQSSDSAVIPDTVDVAGTPDISAAAGDPASPAPSVTATPPVAVNAPSPVEQKPAESPSVPVRTIPEIRPTAPQRLSTADSLLLLIPELAWSDSNRTRRVLTPEIASEHPRGQFVPRTVSNSAWGVGEHLEFSIDYGFYTAGTATMSVLAAEMVNGAPGYHIQTTARSNSFISKFYVVRDQVNSYIDTKGIFSRRIEKILREGDYHSDRFVDFYPDRMIAVSTVDKHPVTEIPLYAQDVLSSLYLIRTYPLEVGKDFNITTYADGKVYPLRVTVHKMETVTVPAGKFRCYVVEPFLQSDGIFRQKGKLTVWLTADEHRIPVKMTSKIVIGSIGTNLTSYRLGVTE